MTAPLISIIIPCHNARRWIGDTIASALAQDWRPLEVIVVDDGSQDDSLTVARAWRAPELQVIATANRGASAARNTGVAVARGEFVQYLDADDLLAPDKLSRQMALASSVGPDVLTFGSVVHFQDGQPPASGVPATARLTGDGADPVEFLIDLLGGNGRGDMVQPGQWLVPRALAERAGPWDESLSVDDDGEYFCRVILAARRIAACPASICYYRKHSGTANLSARGEMSERGSLSQLAATRLKARWLRQRTPDPRVDRALAGSYTSLAIRSYPTSPAVSRAALDELRALGRDLVVEGGTTWFRVLRRLGGWKFARRMQHWMARYRTLRSR